MSEIINPHDSFSHDSFFKTLLARPEVVTDFLTHYLPPEVAAQLDLTAPELLKDSFVDPELQPHLSDLLYRVTGHSGVAAYIGILFEHKSAPDDWVGYQFYRYKARIWEPMVQQKMPKLPPIFPLVVYHGRRRWRVPRNFSGLIEWQGVESLRSYVPEFAYHLVDLSHLSETDIKGAAFLRVGLLLLKYIFSRDLVPRLPEILALLPLPEQSAVEYLRTVLYYLSKGTRKVTERQFATALTEAFSTEGEKTMKSMIDVWIEQGEQKGTAATTLRLLQRRFGLIDDVTQAHIRALPLVQLEQLAEALLDFQKPSDLLLWLRQHTEQAI